MLDLAVLAPDPGYGDGGFEQTRAFLDGARALGREPELLFAPHPALAGRRWSIDRIEALRQARATPRLAPILRRARSAWVVATIATVGGAAPRAGRTYACWIGTSLDDEWRGRREHLSLARRTAFGLSLPTLRGLERRVLQGAARVYATGAGSRTSVAAAADMDEASIGILPIPVDLDRFVPEPDETWTARLERPVLVFVGRASDPRKNVRLLLDALPILRRSVPDARLRLIGEPPRGPLPAGVDVLGRVDSVAEHLRTASLFVLPSFQEGFAIVAAEALAAGVPVLSTHSRGPEELLERSGGGRLVDTFEAEELAHAAADLLADVATLRAMRRRGREYVEREHAPARFRMLLRSALAETGTV